MPSWRKTIDKRAVGVDRQGQYLVCAPCRCGHARGDHTWGMCLHPSGCECGGFRHEPDRSSVSPTWAMAVPNVGDGRAA